MSRSSLVALVFLALCSCKGADSGDAKAGADAKGGAEAKAGAGAEAGEAGEAGQAPSGEAGTEAEAGAEAETGAETETETGEEPEPELPLPDAFETVGVDVCDAYVADYSACIEAKVPEAERDAQRRVVFDNVRAWKQTAAGGPSAAKGLQTACRIAREQAKRGTADWGCEW